MGAPLGQWEQGGGECKPVGDGSAEAATATVSGPVQEGGHESGT